MRSRSRIWTIVALALAVIIIAATGVAVGPLRKFGEFTRAESVKGCWASLQEFQKQRGRHPKDAAEIAAFFRTAADTSPVDYVPPHDDSADEVILWWKDKTIFGVTVGITESVTIVKK